MYKRWEYGVEKQIQVHKRPCGTTGNELADKLAKETSSKTEITVSYNRIQKSTIKRELEEKSNVNCLK